MLLTLYQQSEVFAASRLTSFGDGPLLCRSARSIFSVSVVWNAAPPLKLRSTARVWCTVSISDTSLYGTPRVLHCIPVRGQFRLHISPSLPRVQQALWEEGWSRRGHRLRVPE